MTQRKPVARCLRPVLAMAAVLMLAGCGAVGGSPIETFNLTAPETASSGRTGRGELIVMQPVATAPYTSDRLVVTTRPGSVAYLTGAQWSDQLPVLLQTRIVQTFENSRALRAVGRAGEKMVAAVSLNTEIRRFDIDVASKEAVIEISAKLINDAQGRVRATRIFTGRYPAPSSRGPAAAAALDQALNPVLRDMLRWSVARL